MAGVGKMMAHGIPAYPVARRPLHSCTTTTEWGQIKDIAHNYPILRIPQKVMALCLYL
jgi:hypothetical protein